VNLSKGQLGEGNANLLGGMIITKIYLAAMSRADLTEGELKKLPNFYMYVDEFQSFANESFADILSEARKYKLALVVAHQYIKQMDEKVADAVFGNVGTQIMFRVGAPDAEVLEKEYAPVFVAEDMVSLGMYQIYLKLMIDGVASHPFSAVSLPPIAPPSKSIRDEVIASSRAMYGRPREEVEKINAEWYGVNNTNTPAPERSAPRTEYQRPIPDQAPVRPAFVAPAKNNMLFERERHHALEREGAIEEPAAPQSKPEQTAKKIEKPFAQAFKNISPSEPRPAIQNATLVRPMQSQTRPVVASKGSGPGSPHLSSLKAALADAISQKNNVVPPASPKVVQAQAETASPAPKPKPIETKHEEKAAEIPQAPRHAPEVHHAPAYTEKKREEVFEAPKIKEVPEDVLSALLRGDD
jgi:hypothetical protein